MLNCMPKIIVYVSCVSIFVIVYVSTYTIHDVFVYRVPNSATNPSCIHSRTSDIVKI